MNEVVNIRLRLGGQVAEFVAANLVLEVGDKVVVKTKEGLSLGEVTCLPRCQILSDEDEQLEAVSRKATEEDLSKAEVCVRVEKEAYLYCQERINVRTMPMHLVMVERLLDGSKMIFYFTAEGRIDFRALVKDLASRFRCRVEMRQIGVRNETKVLGGVGSCGRELCCSTFMRKFLPVSVKMAKEQNLSLNPHKISGLCGRLMCCLAYEFPVYMEYKKDMPKLGKRVTTPEGEGKVIRQNVMAHRVTVLIDHQEKEFEASQVKLTPPLEQQQPKKKKHSSHKANKAKGNKK